MPDISLDDLADVAAEAGKLAKARWRGELEIWEKTPGHQVCDVDIAVDELLRERLSALDPGAGFLSEESVDDLSRLSASRVWVVDPIDGTRDFIRGRPGWCISVALVENGLPKLGILEAPARSEQWRAEAGRGTQRNGERLSVSDAQTIEGARIPAIDLPKTQDNLVAVEKPNSIALRIAMVAAGDADMVVAVRWGHEWDIAAAFLMAQEAGAKMTDAFGKPFHFNTKTAQSYGLVATTPAIHDSALNRVAKWTQKETETAETQTR